MKKFLFVTVIIVVVALFFSACSKDESGGTTTATPIGETNGIEALETPEITAEHIPDVAGLSPLDTPQPLVFPPKTNLFQYAASPSGSALYGFPGTRFWGWSPDGKAAYSIERAIDGRGGQQIDFVITDTITDTAVFELTMDSFDHNDLEDEALYHLFEADIAAALSEYNITGQRPEFSQFPARINNITYNAGITVIEYGEPEYRFFDAVVSRYAVTVTRDSQSKTIGTLSPVRSGVTGYVYVCGYFLSPYENRALVVVAEEAWVFEGTELFYRLLGCHLGAGFN